MQNKRGRVLVTKFMWADSGKLVRIVRLDTHELRCGTPAAGACSLTGKRSRARVVLIPILALPFTFAAITITAAGAISAAIMAKAVAELSLLCLGLKACGHGSKGSTRPTPNRDELCLARPLLADSAPEARNGIADKNVVHAWLALVVAE